jgi:hypothetical protein
MSLAGFVGAGRHSLCFAQVSHQEADCDHEICDSRQIGDGEPDPHRHHVSEAGDRDSASEQLQADRPAPPRGAIRAEEYPVANRADRLLRAPLTLTERAVEVAVGGVLEDRVVERVVADAIRRARSTG